MTVIFNYTFDSDVDLEDWELKLGNPAFVTIQDSRLILGNDVTTNGNKLLFAYKNFIAFNPSKYYKWRITCYKNTATAPGSNTNAEIYYGFLVYDSSQNPIPYAEPNNFVGHGLAAHWRTGQTAIDEGVPDARVENTFVGITNGTQASFSDMGDVIEETSDYLDHFITNGFYKAIDTIGYFKPMIFANQNLLCKGRWFINNISLEEIDLDVLADNQGGTSVYTLSPSYNTIVGKGIHELNFNVTYATDGLLFYKLEILTPGIGYLGFSPSSSLIQEAPFVVTDGNGKISFMLEIAFGTIYVAQGIRVTVKKGSATGDTVFTKTFDFNSEKLEVDFNSDKSFVISAASTVDRTVTLEYNIANLTSTTLDTSSIKLKTENLIGLNLELARYFYWTNLNTWQEYLTETPGIQTVELSKNLSIGLGKGKLEFSFGENPLVTTNRYVNFSLVSNTTNFADPQPQVYFDLLVRTQSSINDFSPYGLETYNSSGKRLFFSGQAKAMTIAYGEVTITNSLTTAYTYTHGSYSYLENGGTTYVDVPIPGLIPSSEIGAILVPTVVLPQNCEVFYELLTDILRISFRRNVISASAPTSVTVKYHLVKL